MKLTSKNNVKYNLLRADLHNGLLYLDYVTSCGYYFLVWQAHISWGRENSPLTEDGSLETRQNSARSLSLILLTIFVSKTSAGANIFTSRYQGLV